MINSNLEGRGKSIFKSAAPLYFRLIITSALGIYSSRLILQIIGVDDFGLLNLITGIVILIGFIQGAVSTATHRYIIVECLKGDVSQSANVFSSLTCINLLLAILIFLLGGVAGYYFIANVVNIPENRFNSSIFVFLFSSIGFSINLASSSFLALVLARERFDIYGWISVVDSIFRLGAVLALTKVESDGIVIYSFLTLCSSFLIVLFYILFSNRFIPLKGFKLKIDSEVFKRYVPHVGWNVWGNLAVALSNQGGNILLNVFFGPSVNAARAAASQAFVTLNNIPLSLNSVFSPRIIKMYTEGNTSELRRIISASSRYNFFLLFFASIPFLVEGKWLINIWLVNTPDFTVVFLKILVVYGLIESVNLPLITAAQAVGNMRNYQTVVSLLIFLNLPVSYFLLLHGSPPPIVFVVAVFVSIVVSFSRFLIVGKLLKIDRGFFWVDCICPILKVCFSAFIFFLFFYFSFNNDNSWHVANIAGSMVCILISVIFFGMTECEKIFLNNILKSKR